MRGTICTRIGRRTSLTEEERERLILEHLPQVRLIARRIQERLPENISLEDLVSTGVIGPDLSDRQFRSPPQRQAQDIRRVQDSRRHSGQPARPGLGAAAETPQGQTDRSRHRHGRAASPAQSPTEEEIAAQLEHFARRIPRMAGGNSRPEHRQPGVRLAATSGRDLLHYIADDGRTTAFQRSWNAPNWSGCWRQGIDGIPEPWSGRC